MKKDPTFFLGHILESISKIEKYIEGVTEEQFAVSDEKQDQITRRLEIIGEATKNISDEYRHQHPEIPWRKMAGMRDMVIHQYYNVDYRAVWDTIQLLPDLKIKIEKLLTS